MTTTLDHDAARAEILRQLDAACQAAKRIPRHWTDAKAAVHCRIDGLLTDLEALDG